MKEFDVAIVGGGMVGASFALALRATRLRVLLIEGVPADSATQPSFDDRTTALGNGSRQIFESLGVWPAMSAESTPIRSIHVSDAGRFGVARLDAHEQRVDAFGYVVPNRVIGRVLWEALRAAPNVTLAVPAQLKSATLRAGWPVARCGMDGKVGEVRAALGVAADGAGSVLRASAGIEAKVEDYEQVAIVVNAATDKPNHCEAYERFTASGPIAVLPASGGGYAVIWAVSPARAAELTALDEKGFATELQSAFGWRADAGVVSAGATPIHSRCRVPRRPSPVASCSLAMPRRPCTPSRVRDSTWDCAMPPRWQRCWRPMVRARNFDCARRVVGEVRCLARRGPQRRHAIHRRARENCLAATCRAWDWRAISACCCST
jgi:ubiquinone biosynthesis UbiH/UbiF/VisC/COQ6 family hydroxylase